MQILPFCSPLRKDSRRPDTALPLVCRLTGLRHLILRRWRLTKHDVDSFKHFKNLQKLEVLSPIDDLLT